MIKLNIGYWSIEASTNKEVFNDLDAKVFIKSDCIEVIEQVHKGATVRTFLACATQLRKAPQ